MERSIRQEINLITAKLGFVLKRLLQVEKKVQHLKGIEKNFETDEEFEEEVVRELKKAELKKL